MITTSRIASGFDVELQLGGGWFLTAARLLAEAGLLVPGSPVTVTDARIGFAPGWDLEMDIGRAEPLRARAELDAAGTHVVLTTSMPDAPVQRVPLGLLQDLPERPVLVKLAGDAEHEPVLALLANLDIQAGAPGGAPVSRGDASRAQSFLPRGKHVAAGVGRDTFARLASNAWHTNLCAEDGSHPLPDPGHAAGRWSHASMTPVDGAILLQLACEVPLDGLHAVTLTLRITPGVSDGALRCSVAPLASADTALLDFLFRGIPDGLTCGVMSFVVGLFIGGHDLAELMRAGMEPTAGRVGVKLVEHVVDGVGHRHARVELDGAPLPERVCARDGVARVARPRRGHGFHVSLLDAIPGSIAIGTGHPGAELLYRRSLLVTPVYDDLRVDAAGFGVAGTSAGMERFQPEPVSLAGARYDGERLVALTYRRSDGRQQELSIDEVLARAAGNELRAPFQVSAEPEGATLRIPEGKLACVCLEPVAIRREDTVVREIELRGGLRLRVADAVALQDAGALVIVGYQLVHPRSYSAYFRARADAREDNNFESLPEY
jgi:hypothetical protein